MIEAHERGRRSIHAPLARRATLAAHPQGGMTSFNPRPRAGDNRPSSRRSRNCFNPASTPSRGGRRGGSCRDPVRDRVSIHALARRATATPRAACGCQDSFNPRPRAEGDGGMIPLERDLLVSIHALARRATSTSFLTSCWAFWFQSTPSRGGRPIDDRIAPGGKGVSIHALARRATTGSRAYPTGSTSFNPRPRAEGDFVLVARDLTIWVSIHALARRATLANLAEVLRSRGFNPRPRAEGDGG